MSYKTYIYFIIEHTCIKLCIALESLRYANDVIFFIAQKATGREIESSMDALNYW